jgi:hypothetical protein
VIKWEKESGKTLGWLVMMLGVVFQGPGSISKTGKCGYAKIKNGDK